MKVSDQIISMLRARTHELGTLKAVSDLAGVYPQTIGRWINGDVPIIQDKNVPGLAKALGISEVELYSIAHGAGASVSSEPSSEIADKFDRLAKWLRTKPPHVQEAFLKLADGFEWEG